MSLLFLLCVSWFQSESLLDRAYDLRAQGQILDAEGLLLSAKVPSGREAAYGALLSEIALQLGGSAAKADYFESRAQIPAQRGVALYVLASLAWHDQDWDTFQENATAFLREYPNQTGVQALALAFHLARETTASAGSLGLASDHLETRFFYLCRTLKPGQTYPAPEAWMPQEIRLFLTIANPGSTDEAAPTISTRVQLLNQLLAVRNAMPNLESAVAKLNGLDQTDFKPYRDLQALYFLIKAEVLNQLDLPDRAQKQLEYAERLVDWTAFPWRVVRDLKVQVAEPESSQPETRPLPEPELPVALSETPLEDVEPDLPPPVSLETDHQAEPEPGQPEPPQPVIATESSETQTEPPPEVTAPPPGDLPVPVEPEPLPVETVVEEPSSENLIPPLVSGQPTEAVPGDRGNDAKPEDPPPTARPESERKEIETIRTQPLGQTQPQPTPSPTPASEPDAEDPVEEVLPNQTAKPRLQSFDLLDRIKVVPTNLATLPGIERAIWENLLDNPRPALAALNLNTSYKKIYADYLQGLAHLRGGRLQSAYDRLSQAEEAVREQPFSLLEIKILAAMGDYYERERNADQAEWYRIAATQLLRENRTVVELSGPESVQLVSPFGAVLDGLLEQSLRKDVSAPLVYFSELQHWVQIRQLAYQNGCLSTNRVISNQISQMGLSILSMLTDLAEVPNYTLSPKRYNENLELLDQLWAKTDVSYQKPVIVNAAEIKGILQPGDRLLHFIEGHQQIGFLLFSSSQVICIGLGSKSDFLNRAPEARLRLLASRLGPVTQTTGNVWICPSSSLQDPEILSGFVGLLPAAHAVQWVFSLAGFASTVEQACSGTLVLSQKTSGPFYDFVQQLPREGLDWFSADGISSDSFRRQIGQHQRLLLQGPMTLNAKGELCYDLKGQAFPLYQLYWENPNLCGVSLYTDDLSLLVDHWNILELIGPLGRIRFQVGTSESPHYSLPQASGLTWTVTP
ncbi:MAG: hypothetical protein KDC71_10620 [Acidobacteria bacterium]|nr:hypothetical protein [Acidobacteriota bacterium]